MTSDSLADTAVGTTGGGRPRVEVERLADGPVRVRRIMPDGSRRRSTRSILLVFTVLMLAPVAVWALVVFGIGVERKTGIFAAAGAGVIVLTIIQKTGQQFLAAMRSWTLTADDSGLTIDCVGPFRRRKWRLRRDEIADVRLGFRNRDMSRHAVLAWLEIHRTRSSTLCCLTNSPGDELSRAADALRAALSFSKRDWP